DFESSAVPSLSRRTQFMVRDTKKHKETDGWGYALFHTTGLIFDQDPKVQTAACVACHRLVPHRGYVFSQPMELELPLAKKDGQEWLRFEDRQWAKLPSELQKLVRKAGYGKKQIRALISSPITKNV